MKTRNLSHFRCVSKRSFNSCSNVVKVKAIKSIVFVYGYDVGLQMGIDDKGDVCEDRGQSLNA